MPREDPFRCRRRLLRALCLLPACLLPGRSPAAAPALMLAGRWRDGLDPSAYWVSEKLDGVRAYWDGQQLYFRSGRSIAVPAWFVAGLPEVPFDGELWLGRGRFEQLSGLVRREEAAEQGWRWVRYMVFDLPGRPGPFDERLRALQALVEAAGIPHLQAVPQFRMENLPALAATLARVVAAGGEGLMLHRADAWWQAGRGDAILKLTPFLDAEARVVGHLPGKGRHNGVLGALEVESADGRCFRLGTGFSDAERRDPPAIGSVVTYRYRELTAQGIPRFPVFLRVRDGRAD